MRRFVVLWAAVAVILESGARARSSSSAGADVAKGREDQAFVLVRGVEPLEAKALVADYNRQWKGDARVLSARSDDLKVELGDAVGDIRVVGERLPGRTADTLVAASWQWSGAASAVGGHRAQVMVKVTAKTDDPMENNLRLMRLVTVVAKAAKAAAVCWPRAAMLIDPQTFIAASAAASSKNPPVRMFVNFLPSRLKDGTQVVHSVGLGAFEMPELILEDDGRPDEMSLEMMSMVCEYVLAHRMSLRTGDTLRMTEKDVLKADEIAAPWNSKEVAIKLRAAR
jgi:hypothetical protein